MLFIYSKFKGCHWQDYSPIKKLKILQALENKMAKKQGREALPVVISNKLGENVFGTFEVDGNKKVLYINDILLYEHKFRFFAMNTIFHEGRHAYQYKVINQNKISWFNFAQKRWKKNFERYCTAKEDETIYAMQEVERDAQIYAISKLKTLRHKYSKEKAYHWTLENIVDQFEQSKFDAKKKMGIFYRRKIEKQLDNLTCHQLDTDI